MSSDHAEPSELPDWLRDAAELIDDDALPDPWGGTEHDGGTVAPGLTDGQRSFLVGLTEQPDVPRLRGLDVPDTEEGADTGNPPGSVETGGTGDSPEATDPPVP